MKRSLTIVALGLGLFAAAAADAAGKGAAGKYAEVNGLRMYYEIQGKGEPLVLIHGGMVTIDGSFAKTRPAFNKLRKTIAVELQAHGHTGDIKDRPLTVRQSADDVVALLKHLKVEKADFFGWSLGGAVALDIASRHPALVRKVVVSGTALTEDGMMPDFKKNMASIGPEMFPQEWKDEYARKNPDPQGFPNLVAKIKQFAADLKPMKAEEVRAIRAPLLFLIGDADIVRLEHVPEVKRLLPSASVAVLPMTDHFAPVSRADWMAPMVTAFLEAPMPAPTAGAAPGAADAKKP